MTRHSRTRRGMLAGAPRTGRADDRSGGDRLLTV